MTAPDVTSQRALDRGLVRGVAWMGITKAATQFFSWAAMLLVARLLDRSDYGIVAASATAIGLVGLVTELGLGTAVVARTELTDDQLSQLAGVGFIGGAVAWIVAFGLSFVLPGVLRVPELARILPVSGFVVALAAISTVPMATLRRRMDFKAVSRIELARAFVASAAMLSLAYAWRSYWAMIISEVTAAVVMVALALRSFGLRVRMPRWHDIGPSLRFSRDVLVGRVAWYVYSNADFAVVARKLGDKALGDYSMAWTLVTLPNEKIATLVFGVTPSVFARVRDDLPEFRRYVLLLIEALGTLLFPACIGMALVAPELVRVALGTQWAASVPLVQALSLFAMVRAISPISSQVLVSRGRARAALVFSVAGALILPAAFWIATRWGTTGVALVWPVIFPILAWIQFRTAAKEIELAPLNAFRVLWPSFLGTMLMSAAVLGARSALIRYEAPTLVTLLVSVAVGAVVYAAVMSVVARPRIAQIWRMVRHRQL